MTNLNQCLPSSADATPFFDKSEVHNLDDLGIICKIYTYICPPKLLQRMPLVPSSPFTAGCFQKHQLLSHARRESCIFPSRVEWHRLRFDGSTGGKVHSLMYCFLNLPDRIKCLRCMLRDHHFCCCPANRDAKSQPK